MRKFVSIFLSLVICNIFVTNVWADVSISDLPGNSGVIRDMTNPPTEVKLSNGRYQGSVVATEKRELSVDEKNILPALCNRPEPAIIGSTKTKKESEFFFRPFPSSDRLTFSADDQNYLLDLKTGKETKIPGFVDAFPTPDDNILLVTNGSSVTFHDSKNFEEKFTDMAMHGYYQSAGVLKSSKDGNTYRVMLDAGGKFFFTDYRVNKSGKVSKVRSQPIPLCGNQKELSLPMMSKDGKFVSAFDARTQSTIIFEVDTGSGTCTPKKDLGVATGKVDFSPDGKSVTYSQTAVSSYTNGASDNPAWMRKPNGDMVSNIYVQNLETGATKTLTHYSDSNVLYPAYNMRGEIIARKYDKNGSEFIKLDPKRDFSERPKIDVSQIYSCDTQNKELMSALGLGALFLRYCDEKAENWSAESIILLGRDLDSSQCALLAKKWGKPEVMKDLSYLQKPLDSTKVDLESLKEISSSDLMAACGK